MPSISVNMPAYNAGRHLAAAIESVLRQTTADLELVVVDDGSSDDTADIVRRMAANDPRVQLISRPNTGVVGARNDAWRASRGEFVAVLDADDLAHPGRLARQAAYLRAHPECVAVGSPATIIDDDGDAMSVWFEPLDHEAIDAHNLSGAGGAALCHSSVLMRRAALEQVGGYREPYATSEDLDLWLRLAEIGRLAMLPEPLVSYRCHSSSIGYSQSARQRAAAVHAIADARRRRGLPPLAVDPGQLAPVPPVDNAHLAWMALAGGHARTARKHAWRQLRTQPLRARSWHLLFCALRAR